MLVLEPVTYSLADLLGSVSLNSVTLVGFLYTSGVLAYEASNFTGA